MHKKNSDHPKNIESAGPLVSVIIPTHDRAKFVDLAVGSVLSQTYPRIEVIVVDDGSTDNTWDVLKKYEGKIEYVYQERSERSKARNHGFRHSAGEYICFLDSDDLWLPTKIEKQVEVLNENLEVGAVYAGVQFIDKKGDPCGAEIVWDAPKRQALYEDLMTHNVITGTTSSVMFRRSCLNRVGLFDESMNTCEDLELYLRVARSFKLHKIDLPLVKFRIHGENTQSHGSLMAKGWETILRKISENTPAEFQYYKNEAIVKILAKIASLYYKDRRLGAFSLFCIKSAFDRPNWLIRRGFWEDLLRLSVAKVKACSRKSSNL
jgi:glycosyltransferase involved in cell wall biosynthesis